MYIMFREEGEDKSFIIATIQKFEIISTQRVRKVNINYKVYRIYFLLLRIGS